MDYRISIITGVGEDASGVVLAKDTVENGLNRIRTRLSQEAGGFTESSVNGGWLNGDGRVVTEPGRRFEILAPTADRAMDYARIVGTELHQNSVALQVEQLQLAHVVAVTP